MSDPRRRGAVDALFGGLVEGEGVVPGEADRDGVAGGKNLRGRRDRAQDFAIDRDLVQDVGAEDLAGVDLAEAAGGAGARDGRDREVLGADADEDAVGRGGGRHGGMNLWRQRNGPAAAQAGFTIGRGPRQHVDRVGADELGHPEVARGLVEVERRAELDEAAVAHDRDPVGDGHRFFLVVGDEDHRRLDLAVDADQFGAHLAAEGRVEAGERFVEQEEVRAADERLGNGDALPLAARKLVDAAVEQAGNVEDARDVLGALPDQVARLAVGLEGEADVLAHVEVRVKRDGLEDHRDVALLGRDVVHQAVAEEELAAGGFLQSGQHVERRRLAAARGAEQDQQLAVADLEVEVAHGEDAVELLGDAGEVDGAARRGRAGCRRGGRGRGGGHIPLWRYSGSTRLRLRMRLWNR